MGFDFSQSSLSSGDGIVVERGEVEAELEGEGEGGKGKRVGMSRDWDESQSQGDVDNARICFHALELQSKPRGTTLDTATALTLAIRNGYGDTDKILRIC